MVRSNFVLTVVLLVSLNLVQAADLPRYSLPVGRVLAYSSESRSVQKGQPDMVYHSKWTLWVVGENADGSRRVIEVSKSGYQQDQRPEQIRTTLGYFDIFPDGRVLPNRTLGPNMSVIGFLPPLPTDEKQTQSGWQSLEASTNTTTSYSFKSDRDNQFEFTADQQGPINRIYVTTAQDTLRFDRIKGIIVAGDSKSSQDYGFHSTSSGSMKLESDTMLDASRTAELRKDYDVYFAAYESYQNLLRQASQRPAEFDALSAQAKSVLQAASKQVSSDDVRQELTRTLDQSEQYLPSEREDARQMAKVLNHPARDWSAQDLDGKDWSMKQLAGKVVVMDFWYRGCGWCMYAMPQVKQLATDYKDKPVQVLGMNTDSVQADALFVVKEFDLQYPQIKAQEIPEKFGVHGFPTTIVIDQHGVVRNIHVGWSADLCQSVSKDIDALLNENPQAVMAK